MDRSRRVGLERRAQGCGRATAARPPGSRSPSAASRSRRSPVVGDLVEQEAQVDLARQRGRRPRDRRSVGARDRRGPRPRRGRCAASANAPNAFTQRTCDAMRGSPAARSASDPPTLKPTIPTRSRSTSGRAASSWKARTTPSISPTSRRPSSSVRESGTSTATPVRARPSATRSTAGWLRPTLFTPRTRRMAPAGRSADAHDGQPQLGELGLGARARSSRYGTARPPGRLAEQVQRLRAGVEQVRQHDRRLDRDAASAPRRRARTARTSSTRPIRRSRRIGPSYARPARAPAVSPMRPPLRRPARAGAAADRGRSTPRS